MPVVAVGKRQRGDNHAAENHGHTNGHEQQQGRTGANACGDQPSKKCHEHYGLYAVAMRGVNLRSGVNPIGKQIHADI